MIARGTMYAFFRHNGYLKVQECVPDDQIETMKEVIEQHIRDKVEPFRVNDRGNIKRLDQVIDRDPIFLEVFTSPLISRHLEMLLGPNIEILRNRHNHATVNAKDDIPYRLHRDILQWSRSIVTIIVYLEEATYDNGCTHIVPGSHFLPFAGMPPDGGGGNWMDDHQEYADFMGQALPIPMPKGGILIFDSLVFHSVGVNKTDDTRMSVTMAFRSVDELSDPGDNTKRRLILGERIYKGNDRPH